MSQGFRDWD